MDRPIIEFEASSHIYKLRGREIPSVSEIIKEAGLGLPGYIPRKNLEKASKRGTTLHKALELFDLGRLGNRSAYEPYITAWEAFKREKNVVILESEYIVHTETYAGTLDRLVLLDDQLAIIDIKTGSVSLGHPIQTAAYSMALRTLAAFEDEEILRFCLYFDEDEYCLIEHEDDARDEMVFHSALDIWHYKKEMAKKK